MPSTREKKYGEKLTILMQEYRDKNWKLPAAAATKTLIDKELGNLTSSVLAVKVAEEFWIDICKGLDKVIILFWRFFSRSR